MGHNIAVAAAGAVADKVDETASEWIELPDNIAAEWKVVLDVEGDAVLLD